MEGRNMDKLKYKARAKVNLGLDVCGRLPNGYHKVKMIMQAIDLYDELEFNKRKDPDIILSVDSKDPLGDIGNNLIFRAAKLMKEYYSIKEGIEIHLKKHIPVAAGMAGGSTDAAATMLAMNELFELGQTREQLMEQALRLGADIPFCIQGGTALAEGIGEKLSVLPPMPKCTILIAKPGISVSTKFVYENLHANDLKPEQHPDVDSMIEAMRQKDLGLLCSRMGNVLETVTIPAYPVINEIKRTMMDNGAIGSMMSGSGPTVFGIFDSPAAAKQAVKAVRATKLAKQICLTTPYNVKR